MFSFLFFSVDGWYEINMEACKDVVRLYRCCDSAVLLRFHMRRVESPRWLAEHTGSRTSKPGSLPVGSAKKEHLRRAEVEIDRIGDVEGAFWYCEIFYEDQSAQCTLSPFKLTNTATLIEH